MRQTCPSKQPKGATSWGNKISLKKTFSGAKSVNFISLLKIIRPVGFKHSVPPEITVNFDNAQISAQMCFKLASRRTLASVTRIRFESFQSLCTLPES